MPKYIYKCKECEDIFEASHSMSERLTDCEKCNTIDALVKVPAKIVTQYKDSEAGKTVNEYIEEAKREVKEEKAKYKEQEWET